MQHSFHKDFLNVLVSFSAAFLFLCDRVSSHISGIGVLSSFMWALFRQNCLAKL